MEEKSGSRPHACFLQNRAAANLTGVREVVSFDENQQKDFPALGW